VVFVKDFCGQTTNLGAAGPRSSMAVCLVSDDDCYIVLTWQQHWQGWMHTQRYTCVGILCTANL